MGVVGIIFLTQRGLGTEAFRRSTTLGFFVLSNALCPHLGDSVYLGCLRVGFGSFVSMTPFGPFYFRLTLYPNPLEGGRRNISAEKFFPRFVRAKALTTSGCLGFLSVGAASCRTRHLPFRKHQTTSRLRLAKAIRNRGKNFPSPPTTPKNQSSKKNRSFQQFWFKKIYVWRLQKYLFLRCITLRVGLALRLVWLICRLASQPASICSALGTKKGWLLPPLALDN